MTGTVFTRVKNNPPFSLRCRFAGRHTPPGSSVTFVELSGNKGWIVESASERKVLEKSADGKFMVEHITGLPSRKH